MIWNEWDKFVVFVLGLCSYFVIEYGISSLDLWHDTSIMIHRRIGSQLLDNLFFLISKIINCNKNKMIFFVWRISLIITVALIGGLVSFSFQYPSLSFMVCHFLFWTFPRLEWLMEKSFEPLSSFLAWMKSWM